MSDIIYIFVDYRLSLQASSIIWSCLFKSSAERSCRLLFGILIDVCAAFC